MNTLLSKKQTRGLFWACIAMVGFNLVMAIAAGILRHRGACAGHLGFLLACYGLAHFYSRDAK